MDCALRETHHRPESDGYRFAHLQAVVVIASQRVARMRNLNVVPAKAGTHTPRPCFLARWLILLSQKVAFYEVGWRAQNRRRGDSGHQREAESVKRRDSRQHGGCDGSSTIWDD